MRLAISNIAWDTTEDASIVKLLHQYNIDAIDIAPGKYFSDPTHATDQEIAQVRQWWDDRGIEITGMQALLFGTSGLNVFGADKSQKAMLQHLESICRIGAGLNATRLVFGSPKNRDKGSLGENEANEMASNFFRKLGDIALSYGVILCLEPNPECYGANFMTTGAETAYMVRQIDHPSIKMQYDTGALTINGENAEDILKDYSSLIGHIHASEPDLLPLGDGGCDHATNAEFLLKSLPNHIISIEMLATKNESHIVAIERAIKVAIMSYRNTNTGLKS